MEHRSLRQEWLQLECTIDLCQKLWTQVQVNHFQVLWPTQWNISCLDELYTAWVGLWMVRKKPTKIKKSLLHFSEGSNVKKPWNARAAANVLGLSCHELIKVWRAVQSTLTILFVFQQVYKSYHLNFSPRCLDWKDGKKKDAAFQFLLLKHVIWTSAILRWRLRRETKKLCQLQIFPFLNIGGFPPGES